MQRLAEKIHQEAKITDSKLDDIEAWIDEEAKRVDHLHPKDAKNNCDQIERELQRTEEVIKTMFNDVQVLRDNRYSQANELHRRYSFGGEGGAFALKTFPFSGRVSIYRISYAD